MYIEKSPFYNKKLNLNTSDLNQNFKVTEKIEVGEDKFSFWSWFKGLVNPLQNLPLISGIYSSINSENKESDRDLVQNSLGGFLYGGPFGAIAGFGNWVFNKIFDKTPTELVLDATGISDNWKDKETGEIKTAIGLNDEINKKRLHIQYSGIHEKTIPERLVLKNDSLIKNNNELLRDSSKIPSVPEINVIAEIKEKNNVSDSSIIKNLDFRKKNVDEEITDISPESEKFREINFSYPQWQPNTKPNSESKIPILRQKYEELGYNKKKNLLSLDA